MLPFEQTRHFGTSSDTIAPDANLEFPDEKSFDSWLKVKNEIIEWKLLSTRNAPSSVSKLAEGTTGILSKRGRPMTIEWTKYYTCSFGGTYKARSEGSTQRTTLKPTRKDGCLAKIKVQKLFSGNTIHVTSLNSHPSHSVNDIQTWTISRLSSSTREWLEKAVGSGNEWKDIKRMTRNEVERADFMGGGGENNFEPSILLEILRIKNQDFNNFRGKLLTQISQLHSDCRQSLYKYADMINQAGGL